MSEELIKRLRAVYRVKVPNYIDDAADCIEAQADRIEALTAEVLQLTEENRRLVVFVNALCAEHDLEYDGIIKQ